jgi:hypothetical protein
VATAGHALRRIGLGLVPVLEQRELGLASRHDAREIEAAALDDETTRRERVADLVFESLFRLEPSK